MPRPATRRVRAVRQAPNEAHSKQVKKGKVNSKSNTEADQSDRILTPRRAGREKDDGQRETDKPKWTPGTSHDNAITSSPAENTTTTSIRPVTRARGYSSTLSLVGRKGEFNSRISSTPGFEVSILSNFKRRPRQPSLLQMMQADENSSDLDDDDFLGDLSSPQDESTPLNVARASAVDKELAVSPSRPPAVSSPSSGESRKRKRQLQNDRTDQDVTPHGRSSSLSTPRQNPGTPLMQRVISSPSLTMATPLSTDTTTPLRFSLDSHRKATEASEKAENTETTTGLLPSVTTVSIQTKFLPRRRVRHRQPVEDIDDDSSVQIDPEEDELSREAIRRSQRVRKKGLSCATSRNANAKAGNYKNKKGNTIASPVSQARKQRTYSRQKPQASDKENYTSDGSSAVSSPPQSEDLDSEQEAPSYKSKRRITSHELRQAALKFAEVDKWEMEFEDVSFSEENS